MQSLAGPSGFGLRLSTDLSEQSLGFRVRLHRGCYDHCLFSSTLLLLTCPCIVVDFEMSLELLPCVSVAYLSNVSGQPHKGHCNQIVLPRHFQIGAARLLRLHGQYYKLGYYMVPNTKEDYIFLFGIAFYLRSIILLGSATKKRYSHDRAPPLERLQGDLFRSGVRNLPRGSTYTNIRELGPKIPYNGRNYGSQWLGSSEAD